MIDIRSEQLMTLAAAAAWWSQKIGQKKAATTLWRWTTQGVRAADASRVKLEVVQNGRRLVTSVEAMQRLLTRLEEIREAVTERGYPQSERRRSERLPWMPPYLSAVQRLEAMERDTPTAGDVLQRS